MKIKDKRIIALNRLADRGYKNNRLRNNILITAIILVTVLLTVMFGAGISIVNNVQEANIRLKGTTANTFLMQATETDMKKAGNLKELTDTGWQQFVAVADISETLSDNYFVAMTYYDDVEWGEHILPTISDMQGTYPVDENEVLMSRWCLEQLGIDKPEIGMQIDIPFTILTGENIKRTFSLCGYYEDYIYNPGITPNSGNTMAANLYYINQSSMQRAIGNMVVSEKFSQIYGRTEGLLGTGLVDANQSSDEILNLLYQETGRNDFIVSGLNNDITQAISMAMIPIIVVVIVLISGYLLIYNIINISVMQDMHVYGQLKTIGATGKQIKRIVKHQTNRISIIGIPLGLIIGTIFAVWLVPVFLERMMESSGYGPTLDYKIRITPWIYILTAVFTYCTIWISNRKPCRLAAKVSPIESTKYLEIDTSIKEHFSKNGGKLYRMAFRNVFRNRKRAFITFASLFLGLLIYLIISTCSYGVDYNERYKREIPDNFILKNLSFETDEVSSIEDIFNKNIISEISSWDEVSSIQEDTVLYSWIRNPGNYLKTYINDQALGLNRTTEEVIDDFQTMIVGLPLKQIEKFDYESTFTQDEIQSYLKNGTGIFIADNDQIDYKEITGKKIEFTEQSNKNQTVEYTILGVLKYEISTNSYKKNYHYYGSDYGFSTKFYTSSHGADRWVDKPMIQALRIRLKNHQDKDVLEKLRDLFEGLDSVEINSQLETKALIDSGTQTIRAAGKVIGILLIFLGLMNFVNVIFTNIYSRQKELATLESIGMTKRQIKKVLVLEGLYYCFITSVLLLSIGLVVAYLLSRVIKNIVYFWEFGIPFVSLIVVVVIMVVVCITVPILVYNSISKGSIVERLRNNQE